MSINAIKTAVHSVREQLTPVLQSTAFLEKGVLTPEEFVSAGDHLVFRSPTWQWLKGEASTERLYLPHDKQMLVTRGVPCYKRVADAGNDVEVTLLGGGAGGGGEGDEWVETKVVIKSSSVSGSHSESGSSSSSSSSSSNTTTNNTGDDDDEVSDLTGGALGAGQKIHASAAIEREEEEDDDDYGDLSAFVDTKLVIPKDPAAVQPSSSIIASNQQQQMRRYDIYITYDKYYQTPRVYLKGYQSDSTTPLSPQELFQDIMTDYSDKTATIEAHPLLPSAGHHISIHPCRHAAVMKRIIDDLAVGAGGGGAGGGGGGEKRGASEMDVEMYLLIFIKFLGTMIPTIDYDFTTGVKAKA